MNKGKMIAQGAHAAAGIPNFEGARIAVGVTLEELHSITVKAGELGLPVNIIADSGKTVFHGVSTITCAAIGPGNEQVIDTLTGHLKLL